MSSLTDSQVVRLLREAVGPIVVAQMQTAADLAVKLEVELGEGATWADAH